MAPGEPSSETAVASVLESSTRVAFGDVVVCGGGGGDDAARCSREEARTARRRSCILRERELESAAFAVATVRRRR